MVIKSWTEFEQVLLEEILIRYKREKLNKQRFKTVSSSSRFLFKGSGNSEIKLFL